MKQKSFSIAPQFPAPQLATKEKELEHSFKMPTDNSPRQETKYSAISPHSDNRSQKPDQTFNVKPTSLHPEHEAAVREDFKKMAKDGLVSREAAVDYFKKQELVLDSINGDVISIEELIRLFAEKFEAS
jgi:hypothetical protein